MAMFLIEAAVRFMICCYEVLQVWNGDAGTEGVARRRVKRGGRKEGGGVV
jgi:hypothetical protein